MSYKEIEGIEADTYAAKAINALRKKARGIIGEDILIYNLMDFINFIMINNKFSDHGIFITPENKEEKYIEIIESGKEELIEDLETYITLLDSLKVIDDKKSEYDGLVKSIKNLDDYNDEVAINGIVENYLRR